MFNLFKKVKARPTVVDKVWSSKQAKWNACQQMLAVNPSCLFAAWFQETKEELEKSLGATVRLAGDLSASDVAGNMIVFVEHHPFWKKEQAVFTRLGLVEVPVLSALDDPLMTYFGGEKVIELMKTLGMKEDESVGNKWVVRSIRNAQQKIQDKVEVEKPARSQAEWFSLNLPRK